MTRQKKWEYIRMLAGVTVDELAQQREIVLGLEREQRTRAGKEAHRRMVVLVDAIGHFRFPTTYNRARNVAEAGRGK